MTSVSLEHYPVVTLPDLVGTTGIFVDGDWIESKDQDINGDVRLIQLADIGVGEYLDKSNRFMTTAKAKALKCTFLKSGDILIARMPDPIGRSCIFPGDDMPCVSVVDVCIFRPDTSLAHSNWLVHMINSPGFRNEISTWVTGTTRQRISRGNLSNLKFPLPPLDEQRRIASILDKADTIRKKRQESTRLAEEFINCAFLDMFGDPVTNPKRWPVVRLGDVIEGNPNNGIFRKNEDYGGNVPVIWVKELFTGYVIDTSTSLGLSPTAKEREKYSLRRGDILFCRSSLKLGGIGYTNVYWGDDGEALFECHLIRVRPKKNIMNGVFYNFLLRQPGMRERIIKLSNTVTMSTIGQDQVRNIKHFLPPIILQERFAASVLKSIEKQKSKDAFGELTNQLFNSLSSRAFQGEL